MFRLRGVPIPRGEGAIDPLARSVTRRVSAVVDGARGFLHATLPEPPYDLPPGSPERCGGYSTQWLQGSLPAITKYAHSHKYLQNKEDMWRTPPHEFLTRLVHTIPYHDALKVIMEHSYFFLLDEMLCVQSAPLPHVLYDDFMKCLTFSSLQRVPEEHHALPNTVLRDLLLLCAYHCTTDKHYFHSSQCLFRRMEQQQHVGSEILSAYVYVCAAAGHWTHALAMAQQMHANRQPFSPVVFALMMHPSLTPVTARNGTVPEAARGLVLQQRLAEQLNTSCPASSVALHAIFVYYCLTFQHVARWEVIRCAAQDIRPPVVPLPRTIQMVSYAFAKEKGLRCGPQTLRAIAQYTLQDETADASMLVYVLLRTRRNEEALQGGATAFAALPCATFSAEEREAIMETVKRRAAKEGSYRVAAPLIHYLLHTAEELAVVTDGATPMRTQHHWDTDENLSHVESAFSVGAAQPPSLQDVLAEMRRQSHALKNHAQQSPTELQHSCLATVATGARDASTGSLRSTNDEGTVATTTEPISADRIALSELLEGVQQLDRIGKATNPLSSPHKSITPVRHVEAANEPPPLDLDIADRSLRAWSAQQAWEAARTEKLTPYVADAWMGVRTPY